MNSKWGDATQQMHRTLFHWNYLKELYTADDIETHEEDIKRFQIEKYKDFQVRCAFGADHFDISTSGQFKEFKRYRWLQVSKTEDVHYMVVPQS